MRRTVEVARGGPRPTIRVRRVPACEPPYDDEREQPFWPIANQLALDWSPATSARAERPPPSVPLREQLTSRVPGTTPTERLAVEAGGTAGHHDPEPGSLRLGAARGAITPAASGGPATLTAAARERARPVAAGVSADAKVAVHRFVRLCVEVLNGYRPAAHLRRLSLPGEAAGIVAQGLAAAQRVAGLRKAAQAPGRRAPRRPSPAAVVRLRLCEPRPGAVEAAVALVTGERTWALALRLELHQDTWSATALRLI